MYTISFANPKGGSGKTTAALLLAEQIAVSGGSVAVVDLDPNANIKAWHDAREKDGRKTPFEVHERPAADDTVDLIDVLSRKVDYLILDLEGSKDQMVTYALSRTDLCIVPMDGSPMEARQAAQAVRLVKTTSQMIRRDIDHVLLFTRTLAAFLSSDERDVKAEMNEHGIPSLAVRLAKRSPYTRMFRDNLMLSEIRKQVAEEGKGMTVSAREKSMKQIDGAIQNAAQYAQAVVNVLVAREAA